MIYLHGIFHENDDECVITINNCMIKISDDSVIVIHISILEKIMFFVSTDIYIYDLKILKK